jgi:hypothetical protein
VSAVEAIEAACAAGIRIAIDGDDLVLEAAAPPSPIVLNLLACNKANIVALMRRQKQLNEFGSSRSIRIQSRHEADPGEASPGLWRSKAEVHRCRIVAALNRLPAPCNQSGRRLMAETRKFLRSPWFSDALLNVWSLEALFGIDCGAPLDNFERWGLIVGLALAPQHGDAIEHIDAEHAVIRHLVGPTLKNARRIERRLLPTATTVPWWQSSALMGDVD